MKKGITFLAAAAVALSGMQSPTFAQSGPAVAHTASLNFDANVATLFNTYPNGGPALKTKIADLIVANPQRAADIANYVNTTPNLSEAQRQAAEQGLAEALIRLKVTAQETLGLGGLTPQMIAIIAGLAALGIIVGVAASKKSDNTVSPN